MKLSPEQIAQHAYDAGFRGSDLTTAVAVALAESGGRTTAHNATPPDDSYGLWQINMLGGLGPARRREFGLDSNRELFDPKDNAEAAWEISGKGNSFRPWSTYTNGAYQDHLDEARRAARSVGRDGGHRDDDTDDKGDKGDRKNQGDRRPNGKGGGGRGGKDGFVVDTDALQAYVTRTKTIGEDLHDGAKTLHRVRGIADDSFGKIGKETGFADALDGFATALERQVKAVGKNATRLSATVRRTTGDYREHEQETTDQLLGLLDQK